MTRNRRYKESREWLAQEKRKKEHECRDIAEEEYLLLKKESQWEGDEGTIKGQSTVQGCGLEEC